CCRGSRSARQQNLVDIFQQKRFASRNEDFLDAEIRCFTPDSLHTHESQFSSRYSRRGTHTTVIAMKVAVEVCVKPKSRAQWSIAFVSDCSSATTKNPTRPTIFDR